MKISRAIKTLRSNGWIIEEAQCGYVACKDGERAISILGDRHADEIKTIAVCNHREHQQFDVSSDLTFCPTIKEAMRIA